MKKEKLFTCPATRIGFQKAIKDGETRVHLREETVVLLFILKIKDDNQGPLNISCLGRNEVVYIK